MPAYSFQPRFVEPIRAGTKGGTIRAARKIPVRWGDAARARRPGGHAVPYEFLDLYCRQRQPSGFFICQRKCVAVERIELNFISETIAFPSLVYGSKATLDAFAQFDGFLSFAEMADFWKSTHDSSFFDGWHIRWRELPEAIR